MTTWAQMQSLLCGHWPVAKKSDTALLLLLDIEGHRQKILVEESSGSRPAVVVVAEIASGKLFPPEKALDYNATAEHGALALARGMLVIRQLLPMEGLTLDHVEGAIRAACVEATRIRGLVARPAMHVEVSRVTFAHMVD